MTTAFPKLAVNPYSTNEKSITVTTNKTTLPSNTTPRISTNNTLPTSDMTNVIEKLLDEKFKNIKSEIENMGKKIEEIQINKMKYLQKQMPSMAQARRRGGFNMLTITPSQQFAEKQKHFAQLFQKKLNIAFFKHKQDERRNYKRMAEERIENLEQILREMEKASFGDK